MKEMKFGTRVEVAERMTAEEFLELAPEDRKAELIDGVMIMSSPALDIHERLFGFLFRLISEYVEAHDLGEVRGSRTPVVLASDQVYEPDILFVARERAGLITERGVMGAPDLVVEILSRATVAYDRGPKLRAYERAGVREVWLDRSVWAGGDGVLPAGRGAVRAGPGGGRGVAERGDPGLCVAGRVAVAGGAVHPRPGGPGLDRSPGWAFRRHLRRNLFGFRSKGLVLDPGMA
jgi:hypothetical protein